MGMAWCLCLLVAADVIACVCVSPSAPRSITSRLVSSRLVLSVLLCFSQSCVRAGGPVQPVHTQPTGKDDDEGRRRQDAWGACRDHVQVGGGKCEKARARANEAAAPGWADPCTALLPNKKTTGRPHSRLPNRSLPSLPIIAPRAGQLPYHRRLCSQHRNIATSAPRSRSWSRPAPVAAARAPALPARTWA